MNPNTPTLESLNRKLDEVIRRMDEAITEGKAKSEVAKESVNEVHGKQSKPLHPVPSKR